MQISLGAVSDVTLRARTRWHTAAGALIGAWVLVGLAVAVAYHLGGPVVWWDFIHTFTLGAVTTAIVVYSTHFTEALTRTPTASYRGVAARVVLVQVGLVGLLVDRAGYSWSLIADASCALILLAAAWQVTVIVTRLRRSLSGAFAVTVPFYVAAFACFIAAVALAVLAGRGIGDYTGLIAAHSRLMVWGFAWLTILGTVVTLLPTLTGTAISPTARARCTRSLVVHAVALAAAAAGLTAGAELGASFGMALVALASGMLVVAVVGSVLAQGPGLNTASLSVLCGLGWMWAVNAADAVSLAAGAFPRAITLQLLPVFLLGGLVQLVTGVLHHLLPTLRGGGPAVVHRARKAAGAGCIARLVCLNVGAALILVGNLGGPAGTAGLILVGLALLANVVVIATVVAIVGRKHD
ncbi:beta-carotene 15,15'-monooxygenase [Corynebacterium confusum]